MRYWAIFMWFLQWKFALSQTAFSQCFLLTFLFVGRLAWLVVTVNVEISCNWKVPITFMLFTKYLQIALIFIISKLLAYQKSRSHDIFQTCCAGVQGCIMHWSLPDCCTACAWAGGGIFPLFLCIFIFIFTLYRSAVSAAHCRDKWKQHHTTTSGATHKNGCWKTTFHDKLCSSTETVRLWYRRI